MSDCLLDKLSNRKLLPCMISSIYSYIFILFVLAYSKFIQVIGKVNQKNSLEAHAVQTVSENFDLELYAKTLKVCTLDSYRALFA